MNKNKDAGTRYELKIIGELVKLGFSALSSRLMSRYLDSKKVDIVTNFPFHIQCKHVQRLSGTRQILAAMPKDKPGVIFHSNNKQGEKNKELAIMDKEEFYKLVKNGLGQT